MRNSNSFVVKVEGAYVPHTAFVVLNKTEQEVELGLFGEGDLVSVKEYLVEFSLEPTGGFDEDMTLLARISGGKVTCMKFDRSGNFIVAIDFYAGQEKIEEGREGIEEDGGEEVLVPYAFYGRFYSFAFSLVVFLVSAVFLVIAIDSGDLAVGLGALVILMASAVVGVLSARYKPSTKKNFPSGQVEDE